MMNQNAIVVFSLIAELFILGVFGFVLGWILVLSSDSSSGQKLKFSVAFLFATVTVWLGYSAPQVLLLFYAFKLPLLILLSFIMTIFFFRDPDLNKRQRPAGIKNILLIEVIVISVLLIMLFIGVLIGRVAAIFVSV